MKMLIFFSQLWLLAILAACSNSEQLGPRTEGVYMIVDTSGTYTKELTKAQKIINVILSKLDPGDAFAVARIDTGSFSEKDIVAKVRFDDRPSTTNQQKRRFRDAIDKFVKTARPSSFTDVTGGILQGIEYLNEQSVDNKTIIIFSDLEEDLKEGYVRDIPFLLDGFKVIAVNVSKLAKDNRDPRKYMTRLESWQQRVESGEGTWRVINDLDRLDTLLSSS